MNSMSLKLLRACNSHAVLSKFTRRNDVTHSIIGRFLFTQESLKIENFKNSAENFTQVKDVNIFKGIMHEKCNGGVEYLIFINELKTMLMISKTDEDIELLLRMVKKFGTQGNVIRFGSVSFGPQIMRLFYVLNKPEKALEFMKDPEASTVLNDITSFLILGDLLFKNEMHEEVLDLFHLIESKQLKEKYPSNLVILFFASCYKMNSRKSYEEATKMVELFKQIGFKIPYRGVWFYAALALNQKEPNKVLEILNSLRMASVQQNIRALALLELNYFQKLFDVLNETLNNESSEQVSYGEKFITKDTLEHLEKHLRETNDENFKTFQEIKEKLISKNLISTKSLEDYLLQNIEFGAHLKNKVKHKQR